MEWAILLAAGFAAGLVSGLFGVGGGIVMTPVLHYAIGYSWAEAVALSLFVMAIQAPIGLWRHHGKGVVRLAIGIPLVIGGAGGVALGHWLLPKLDVPWLKLSFAALMLFAAFRLGKKAEGPSQEHIPSLPILLVLGFGAGVIARLLGIGGGILIVPVLVLLGVPPHVAVGSSLIPVFTNAFGATVVNLFVGLQWWLALPLAIGAVVGAPTGVWVAHELPEKVLRTVIAVALALFGVLVAITSGVI